MTLSETDYSDSLQERVSELEEQLKDCERERDELLKNELRHRLLLDACPHGVVIHDRDKILYANESAAKLAKADSADELVGKPIWDFVDESERDHIREKFSGPHEVLPEIEFVIKDLRRLDGQTVTAEVAIGDTTFDGEPARIASIKDITKRVDAEESRNRQQSAITRAQRLATIGEMSASLMHEINNPLSAIQMYAHAGLEAFNQAADATDKIRDCLGHVHEQAERVQAIIARMRTFARSAAPELSPVSSNQLVRHLIPLLQIECERFRAKLVYELDDGIPDVLAERMLIEQVLVNLVSNAVEAMAATPLGDRIVTIRTELVDAEVQVSVRDRGAGITPKDLERVFDQFFTARKDGIGLGLAISKTIVESHGGRIWVEPNDDRGVTFRFTLPTE